MPTFLRLIIMLGEIFGFIFISIVLIRKCDITLKKTYSEKRINKIKKDNIIYVIGNSIIIVLILFLSFPQLIFLSYHKMIYLSVFIVFAVLNMSGDYVFHANINEMQIKTSKKVLISVGVCTVSVFAQVICIILIFVLSFTGNITEFKVLTDQKENVEIIYPELMDEDKKIGHIRGTNRYVCFHKDSVENWTIIDNMEIMPENVKRSDDTFIKKYTVTKTFNDIERDNNSDKYVITENEVTYVLYLNPKQLAELDKAE